MKPSFSTLTNSVLAIVMLWAMTSCEKKSDAISEPQNTASPEAETTVLSPDEQEQKLKSIGNRMVANFQSADYKSLWELVDYCYGKFEDYSWDEFEELGDMARYVGTLSHNLGDVASGDVTVLSKSYVFSMPKVFGIYTADDNTRTWKRKDGSENTFIVNFKKNSKECSIKVTTSGKTYNVVSYWTESEYVTNYNYYYNYWDYQYNENIRPVEFCVPETTTITITEGGYEHLNLVIKFDMKNNSYFKNSIEGKISSLNIRSNIDIKSTSCTASFEITQNSQQLFYSKVDVPTYAIYAKDNNESYEEYADRYAEAYEKGNNFSVSVANAQMNIMNSVQIKAQTTRPVSFFRDLENIREKYRSQHPSSQSTGMYYDDYMDYNQAMADCFSNNIDAKMYYGSNIVQAELAWSVTSSNETRYAGYNSQTYRPVYKDVTVWRYSPVLSFPYDNSKIAFGDYFTSKVYNGFLSQIEDLCNSYICTAKYLHIEPVSLTDY